MEVVTQPTHYLEEDVKNLAALLTLSLLTLNVMGVREALLIPLTIDYRSVRFVEREGKGEWKIFLFNQKNDPFDRAEVVVADPHLPTFTNTSRRS